MTLPGHAGGAGVTASIGPPAPSPTDDWTRRAACAGMDVEAFFSDAHKLASVAVCQRCPVRRECLTDSLSGPFGVQFGVWGGFDHATRLRAARAWRAGRAPHPADALLAGEEVQRMRLPNDRADLIALGTVLRTYRERASLSRNALKERARLGGGTSAVAAIERGERTVTFNTVRRLLWALGVSWETFGKAFAEERAMDAADVAVTA